MRYLNPDTTLRYVDNTFRQHEVYVSSATHYIVFDDTEDDSARRRGKLDVGLSVDYQWNGLKGVLQGTDFVSRNTVLLAGAAGYQWWRLKLMASVMGTFVRDRMTDNTSECTPSVFLSMTPVKGNKDLELRAFYKRIFRMPTFNDLYYTDMGNKYLEPEYTTQYDVGITWKHAWAHNILRRLELKADGYFNQVDNKIVAVPKGNSQYRWMMMNLGYVEILGAEFQFKTDWQFSPDWRLDFGGNYTYQKARDYSDPKDNDPVAGTWGGQIAYIPWHSASAMGTLTWLMKRNMDLMLNYSFIYTGERYHGSSNILANYEQPWYTHDLSLRYGLRLRHVRLAATLEVNNVFDQQYDVVLNYPMPGRNFKGIISCEF
jgi:outer membrane receptor protein involved in Fe transport